jgi:hypothetical protein
MRTKQWVAVIAAALVTLLVSSSANAGQADVSAVRAATARFHDIDTAIASGYGQLRDAAGIACIDNQPTGTMGVHYVKGALVGDATVNALTPEALVYEPGPNGKLRLVAVEYVVFQGAWDAANAAPPSLFGQTFTLIRAGNRYALPPFYELHAWLWNPNPSGMFKDWNPSASCARA